MKLQSLSLEPWKGMLSIYQQKTEEAALARYLELNPKAVPPVELRFSRGRLTLDTFEGLAIASLKAIQEHFKQMVKKNKTNDLPCYDNYIVAIQQLQHEAFEAPKSLLILYENLEEVRGLIRNNMSREHVYQSFTVCLQMLFDRYNQRREEFVEFARKNHTDLSLKVAVDRKAHRNGSLRINGPSIICDINMRKLVAVVSPYGSIMKTYNVPMRDIHIQFRINIPFMIMKRLRAMGERAQAEAAYRKCEIEEVEWDCVRPILWRHCRLNVYNAGKSDSAPHVGTGGYVCLGDYSPYVRNAMSTLDLNMVIHWLREWAQTYIIGNTGGPIQSIDYFYMGIPEKFGKLGMAAGQDSIRCARQHEPTLEDCNKIKCQISKECSHYRKLSNK